MVIVLVRLSEGGVYLSVWLGSKWKHSFGLPLLIATSAASITNLNDNCFGDNSSFCGQFLIYLIHLSHPKLYTILVVVVLAEIPVTSAATLGCFLTEMTFVATRYVEMVDLWTPMILYPSFLLLKSYDRKSEICVGEHSKGYHWAIILYFVL